MKVQPPVIEEITQMAIGQKLRIKRANGEAVEVIITGPSSVAGKLYATDAGGKVYTIKDPAAPAPAAKAPAVKAAPAPAKPAKATAAPVDAGKAKADAKAAAGKAKADAKAAAVKAKAAKAEAKAPKAEAGPRGSGTDGMSMLDAAVLALKAARKPLNTVAICAIMKEKGLWTTTSGKTPQCTLHAAISREIKVKGAESRFVKSVERGMFTTA